MLGLGIYIKSECSVNGVFQLFCTQDEHAVSPGFLVVYMRCRMSRIFSLDAKDEHAALPGSLVVYIIRPTQAAHVAPARPRRCVPAGVLSRRLLPRLRLALAHSGSGDQ